MIQIYLRKTSELTVEEGINHTELINMVSEGVRAAMESSNRQERMNLAQENNTMQQQLDEMKTMMEQMKTTHQAIQVTAHQNPNLLYQKKYTIETTTFPKHHQLLLLLSTK